MVILFLIGYACIALEHNLKINKAATALLLSSVLWTIYIFYAQSYLPNVDEFIAFCAGSNHDVAHDVVRFVTEKQIIEHVGDVAEIIFFLLGAMTIVELIDVHGGFSIITDKITTKNKKKLLWTLSIITFIMSAILDNLTTTIVMVMLLRKLINSQKERWLFACAIILAANSGGAFSPIGDVTTIMLWVKGNVTTQALIPQLIVPSIISAVLPIFLISLALKGQLEAVTAKSESSHHAFEASKIITPLEQKSIFFLGVGCLIFVPIFKSFTHLPPFLGVLLGLGAMWIYTEVMYGNKKNVPESSKARISVVLGRIDFTTILFFLGILMAVAALQCAGILHDLSILLEEKLHNIYLINILIGILSSIVDNVPLVAGAMGMYDIAPVGCAAELVPYMQDGVFWLFLTYCAGVGGSILIIGSAAGVVVMGLEKVDFVWYLKHISLYALLGYLAGAIYFIIQETYLMPALG